jgi:endonuclease III-like uncharacterized protein
MDFYLDNLLSFPDVTVSSCQQQESKFVTVVMASYFFKQTAKTIEKYLKEICHYFVNHTTSDKYSLSPQIRESLLSTEDPY